MHAGGMGGFRLRAFAFRNAFCRGGVSDACGFWLSGLVKVGLAVNVAQWYGFFLGCGYRLRFFL